MNSGWNGMPQNITPISCLPAPEQDPQENDLAVHALETAPQIASKPTTTLSTSPNDDTWYNA